MSIWVQLGWVQDDTPPISAMVSDHVFRWDGMVPARRSFMRRWDRTASQPSPPDVPRQDTYQDTRWISLV